MPRSGRIAFISQSGALCTSILDWSLDEHVGFSHFVSIGNALNVKVGDLIDYLGDEVDLDVTIFSDVKPDDTTPQARVRWWGAAVLAWRPGE